MSYERDMAYLRSDAYDRWKCDPPDDYDDDESYYENDGPEWEGDYE
jgi:hypothetical protein